MNLRTKMRMLWWSELLLGVGMILAVGTVFYLVFFV